MVNSVEAAFKIAASEETIAPMSAAKTKPSSPLFFGMSLEINNPIAVIPAALFFAYLDAGARAAMLHSDVTYELAKIAQAVIFFLVTAQALYGFFKSRKKVAA